jgi:hypothetical protein
MGLYVGRYKFDDERVTKEELKRALEEQYGGEEEVRRSFFFLFKGVSLFLIVIVLLGLSCDT